ncbi:MAG: helical backbone metal receptor, partial [Actinomycetota bacterium]
MAPRVVSLVPSATETLLSLGANVVGCTRFCEQPHIPSVGGTKNPDVAAIVESAPDLVVLDREENRREDHDALVDAGLDVFVSSVTTVADGVAVVGRLAELVGVPAPSGIEPELIVAGPPAPAERSLLRAFVPIWRRPWMTIGAGTYGGDLLRH